MICWILDSPGMVIDEKETENMDDEGESTSDIDKSLTISEKGLIKCFY